MSNLTHILNGSKIISIKNEQKGEVDVILNDGRHLRLKAESPHSSKTPNILINIFEIDTETKGWFIFKRRFEKEIPIAKCFISSKDKGVYSKDVEELINILWFNSLLKLTNKITTNIRKVK